MILKRRRIETHQQGKCLKPGAEAVAGIFCAPPPDEPERDTTVKGPRRRKVKTWNYRHNGVLAGSFVCLFLSGYLGIDSPHCMVSVCLTF